MNFRLPKLRARSKARSRPRRPKWAHRIGAVFLLAGLLAGIALIWVGNAAPAHASFMGVCDPDTSLPAISGDESLYTKYVDSNFNGHTVISPAEAATPAQAYGPGVGMEWSTFGLSCMDAMPAMMTSISNIIFQVATLMPVRALGGLLDIAFTGAIAKGLSGIASEIQGALYDTVYTTWAPLLIGITLMVAIIGIARGRADKWKAVGWIFVVFGALFLLVSGTGLKTFKTALTTVSEVATCAAFSTSGGCDDGGDVKPSAAFVEGLVSSTWGSGALGELATKPAPLKIWLTERGDDPKFSETVEMSLPVYAIPSVKHLEPTYGEVLRWTQTYTAAETAAMSHKWRLRCTAVGSSPKSHEFTKSDRAGIPKTNLCTYKWAIRYALISDIIENHPQAYGVFSGGSSVQLAAAFSGFFLLPVIIGIGILAILLIAYQIELVTLFIAVPIFGLLALFKPAAGREWGERIVSALVRIVGVGLTTGVVLLIANQLTVWTLAQWAKRGGQGAVLPLVAAAQQPVLIGLLMVTVLIGGWKLLTAIQETLTRHLGAVGEDAAGGAAKTAMLKTATGVVGAGAGALSATGAGAAGRLAGAGIGLLRGSQSGSITQAATRGATAGAGAALMRRAKGRPRPEDEKKDEDTTAKDADQVDPTDFERDDRTPPPGEDPTPPPGDDSTPPPPGDDREEPVQVPPPAVSPTATQAARQRVLAAWEALLRSPEIVEAQRQGLENLEAEATAAGQAVTEARGALAAHREHRAAIVAGVGGAMLRDGTARTDDPYQEAAEAWEARERDLVAALSQAGARQQGANVRVTVAHETGEVPATAHLRVLVEDRELDAEAVGVVLGLSPETTGLLRKTKDAVAEADEVPPPTFGAR